MPDYEYLIKLLTIQWQTCSLQAILGYNDEESIEVNNDLFIHKEKVMESLAK